jgi:hypothetical protein
MYPEELSSLYPEELASQLWSLCTERNAVNVQGAGPSGRAVYGVDLRPLACSDRGFKSRQRHLSRSLVSVACCQVEVSVTS